MSGARVPLLGPRSGPPVAWVAVFLGSLLLAALLAPAAYAALLAIDPELRYTLSRVFNRVAMLAAVAMLVVFRGFIGWPELRHLLGRGSRRQRAGLVLVGLGSALVAVVAGLAWAFATGQLGWTLQEYHFLAPRTAAALAGGLLAAAIEESFFRGLMLASLAAACGWWAAAVISSGAYSAVHLLVSDRSFEWHGYSVGAGLAYLQHAVARQLEPASLPPLAGLALGGLVLALLVRRSGSLYLAIGVHAGWAFAFPVVRHATRVLHPIPGSSFLATHHYVVGAAWAWGAMILSGLLAIGLYSLRRRGAECAQCAPPPT